jgi:error-prone DNA polymerase
MGWSNPPIPWAELERTLSGRRPDDARDGGDGPAFSRKRGPYLPPVDLVRDADALPYAELHAHSSFSFLDGASSPEELLEEAERLGLSALALVDHDTFAGLVRFAEAAETSSVATIFGAELSLGLSGPQNGEPDPEGEHLVVLARGLEGYHRLSHAMTEANLHGGEKGRPVYDLEQLAATAAARCRRSGLA